jgi:HEAT repeat protein
MASRLPVAPLLGALIHLTRYQPDAEAAQAALLAVLEELLREPLRVSAEPDALHLGDERVSLKVPGATLLNEQMLMHGIGAFSLPGTVNAADLLRLVSVLAAFPGSYASYQEIRAALGDSGDRIALSAAGADQEVVRLSGSARSTTGSHRTVQDVDLDIHHGETDTIGSEPEQLMEEPARLPEGMAIPVRPTLGAIVALGRTALKEENWNGVLDAALQLIEAENEAPSERTGQTYRLELKRLIAQEHLERIARLANGERAQEVIAVLARFGAAGTETLVELLTNSPDLSERRSYYTAITQMRSGAEAIFGRLDHPLWYVVRNAAELCGEMEIEDAVPALGRQIHHADERARKAIAGALARIGTPLALQWLRKVLNDAEPQVRRQALQPLSAGPARLFSSAIAERLERESDPEVQREALLALGRSGSPEAIATLEHWAAPASDRVGKHPLPIRLLAIRGLAQAGPPGATALSSLTRDPTPEVRAAASGALAALRL